MLEILGSFLTEQEVENLWNLSRSATEGTNAIVEEYFKNMDEDFAKFTEEFNFEWSDTHCPNIFLLISIAISDFQFCPIFLF